MSTVFGVAFSSISIAAPGQYGYQMRAPEEVLDQATQLEDQIVVLIAQQNYDQACSVLDHHFPIQDTTDEQLFLHARCRMGVGDYQVAQEMYKILQITSPDSEVIQEELELTEKILSPKEQEWKDGELQLISNLIDPSITGVEINQAYDSKAWFAQTEFSTLYDTNINTGPNDETLVLAGGQPIDALGYKAFGLFGYLNNFGERDFLLTRVTAEFTDYFNGNDNSFGSYSLSVGPIFSRGDTRISLSPGFTWQNYAGKSYSNAIDISGRVTHDLTPNITVGASSVTAKNTYVALQGYDGFSSRLSPFIEYKNTFNDRDTRLQLSAIGKIENAEDDIRSSRTLGGRVDFEHEIVDNIEVNASYQKTKRQFDRPEVFFSPLDRADDQQIKSVGVSWRLGDWFEENDVSIGLNYLNINNASNSPIYSYKRDTTTLSVTKNW